MRKIGIFGGTFNPPHTGHVLAAKHAREALGLDLMLILPAAQPPHKEVPEGSPSAELRLEMTRAAFAGEENTEVSDLELQREGKSYTSDTLRELKKLYPEDTLYFVMGTDMFLSLHTWHEPEVICSLAVLVALEREEKHKTEEMLAQKQMLEEKFGARIELLPDEPIEISSSRVRRMMVLGGVEHYVAPAVMEVVHANNLYGINKNYKNLSMDELRDVCVGLLKKKRVNHVLGCAETAVKLAEKYGADPVIARRAGLLHDITKAIDGPDQLLLVDKYDILISDFERRNPKLLHAKTGSAVAKYVFGECPEIVDAIYWHTTGKPDMALMEKIVYIADYMEPTRDFPGVDDLRKTVWKDLDRGLLMGFEMCIEELERENKTVCEDSVTARDYMRRQLGILPASE